MAESTGRDPTRTRQHLDEALRVLRDLGLPRQQQNERSALTLLALLDLTPDTPWSRASSPLRGITPMMDFFAEHYGKHYMPNTRETVRRQTVHQFLQAGLIRQNPDDPARATNSAKNVYQIDEFVLAVLRTVWQTGMEQKPEDLPRVHQDTTAAIRTATRDAAHSGGTTIRGNAHVVTGRAEYPRGRDPR